MNFLGKIRGIIPYQPAFRKFDVVMDPDLEADEANGLIPSTCHECEERQVSYCFLNSLP